MDENMNKDNITGEEAPNEPVTPKEPPKAEPVNTPIGNTYGEYRQKYTYGGQNGQMPYGGGNYSNNNGYNYNYANSNPNGFQPAQKKESKGKKKGSVVAVIIIVSIVIIALGVLFSALFGFDNSKDDNIVNDDTQMDLVESPSSNKETVSGDALSAGDVYKKVHESSVGILVYTKTQQSVYSEGTGVVMGLTGDKKAMYVVTCAHVIDARNPQIIVQSADGTQYDATVIGSDAKTDIGLLRVDTTELKAAEFATSDNVSVGDTVYAIGNPGGTQFFGSFTNGMVSAIGRPIDSPVGYEVACVQHTAPINPGNSGGALVNEYGQIIGINSSKIASTEYEGMGFAVPSSTVKEVVDELIKNGYVSNRPVLGFNFLAATQSQTYSIIVKANKLPAGSIVINSIMNGSDLLNTDAKEGDMIIAVNGKELDTYDVLLDIVENGKVGDTITLTICRVDSNYNISKFDVKVKLVEDSSTSEVVQESTDSGFYFPFGN